jgi:acyl phosphate:glycerol-3-phosphate acyltransferase
MAYLPYIAASVVGYILGSVPNGYLVARAHGVDIFKEGSGNPGATNVKRVLGEKFGDKGRRAGNWVFVLDAVKGALAAGWPLVCCCLQCCALTPDGASHLGLIGVVAAVLGHSFSMFTRFKGGKGVATAVGGLIVMIPIPCVIGFAVWIASFYLTRYVSLGSILGAVVVPTASWIQCNQLPINVVTSALGLFVIYRHRENIKRLLNGTENRFVKKSAVPDDKGRPGT